MPSTAPVTSSSPAAIGALPSAADALLARRCSDNALAMRRLRRRTLVLQALTLAYFTAYWLLGLLPGTQVLLYAVLASALLALMQPLARSWNGRSRLGSWGALVFICASQLACVPALMHLPDVSARATTLTVAMVTILWSMLRQSPMQMILSSASALAVYAWIASHHAGPRLHESNWLTELMVMAGVTGACVQLAYTGSHVRRLRRVFHSITARIDRTIERLEYRALHDPTTGLANRTQLERSLTHAWQAGCAQGTPVALCLFGPSEPGRYTELLGERAGDEILRRIAEAVVVALDGHAPPDGSALIARHGASRFVLLLAGAGAHAAAAQATVQALAHAVATLDLADLLPAMALDCGFGWACAARPGSDGATQDDLLAAASTALQQAQQAGNERIVREAVIHDAEGPAADQARSWATLALNAAVELAAGTSEGARPLPGSPAPKTRPIEAYIGSAHLPWRTPFTLVLTTTMLLDMLYIVACWALGYLAFPAMATFCTGATLTGALSLALSRRVTAMRGDVRARLVCTLLLLGAPPLMVLGLSIDNPGARVGWVALNCAPVAGGILLLSPRRHLAVAAGICASWAAMLGGRHLLGIPGHWPGDALAVAVGCTMAVSIAFVGASLHEMRVRVADYSLRLRELMRRLTEMSLRDDVSGLLNRRGVMQRLHRAIVRAERSGVPLSVCMVEVHDPARRLRTLGPIQLERRSAKLAAALIGATRELDTVGQLGDGRFLLVLPAATQDNGLSMVSRLRERIAMAVPADRSSGEGVDAMFGVAQWGLGQHVGQLMAQAELNIVRTPLREMRAAASAAPAALQPASAGGFASPHAELLAA